MAKLILIHGPVAAGKTTFAKRLEGELQIPLFMKDQIKELLFDSLGTPNSVAESQHMGGAALDLSWYIVEELAKQDSTFAYEANISERHHGLFLKLQREKDLRIFEVLVDAENEDLIKRFQTRYEAKDRHPGHQDSVRDTSSAIKNADLQRATLANQEVLRTINTSKAEPKDVKRLIAEIESFV